MLEIVLYHNSNVSAYVICKKKGHIQSLNQDLSSSMYIDPFVPKEIFHWESFFKKYYLFRVKAGKGFAVKESVALRDGQSDSTAVK